MPYVDVDVCVLSAAYPDEPLREEGAVGWRAQVARKRGVGTEVQVRVFGCVRASATLCLGRMSARWLLPSCLSIFVAFILAAFIVSC